MNKPLEFTLRAWLTALLLAASAAHAQQAAWLAPEGMPQGSAARAPLGSLWKLFVYADLAATGAQEPAYRCASAQRGSEDDYCCEPGDSVARDAALARSCGAYFAPQRLGLTAATWAERWRARGAPTWLHDLAQLQPATVVPVPELLRALAAVPPEARAAARRALLPIATREPSVLAALGSGPRLKTWSWRDAQGAPVGGAAGWLADGVPVWFGAPGSGSAALARHAGWLAQTWPAATAASPPADGPCVDVHFFNRYPLARVEKVGAGDAVPGPLSGRHRLTFANGQRLVITAQPALLLRRDGAGWAIDARLTLDDYVARVIDREGDAREPAAAQALAVAARSYVLQQAREDAACRRIGDDSRTQRVSPNPPTAAARRAAAHTQDLVLDAPVRYHQSQPAPGVLAWQQAVAQSRAGRDFTQILAHTWPAARLVGMDGLLAADCTALPAATAWLAERQHRWRERLRREPGYEPLVPMPRICQLALGLPHADSRRGLIRVRDWHSPEGRIGLVHEYLHLAFAHHPSGQDEAYIEALARELAP
ncbi:MAG: DUF2300 domain-containing protein [Proteobacteria bacterium]|nr:DUF2300 domain-containing protein [Pseudomonadota bacterium]